MKSFLLKNNVPILRWSQVPQNCFFEGPVPKNYSLAVCPSDSIVVLDVDVKNDKNGFNYISINILEELEKTFNYKTKSGGRHYWIDYTGNKELRNKATEFGLDLRVGAKEGNAGGYVKYVHTEDIRECMHLIKETSKELNQWLEELFSYERDK